MEYIKDTQVRKGYMSVFRAKTQKIQMKLFAIFIYLEALKRNVENLIALVFWVFKVNKKLCSFALREKTRNGLEILYGKKFPARLKTLTLYQKTEQCPGLAGAKSHECQLIRYWILPFMEMMNTNSELILMEVPLWVPLPNEWKHFLVITDCSVKWIVSDTWSRSMIWRGTA